MAHEIEDRDKSPSNEERERGLDSGSHEPDDPASGHTEASNEPEFEEVDLDTLDIDNPALRPLLATPTETARVVDHAIRLPSPLRVIVSWVLYVFVFMLIMVPILMMMRGRASMAFDLVLIIAVTIVASMILGFLPAIQKWRAKQRARRLVLAFANAPVEDVVRHLHASRPWFSGIAGFAEMMRLLGERGRKGVILRLGRPTEFTPISPTDVDFEPRLLDETDDAFLELEQALVNDDEPHPARRGGKRKAPSDGSGFGRRIWRNITLKEGRLSLVILLIFVSWAAYRSFTIGKMTPGLIIGTLILAARLFQPATGGSGSTQWLVIPQGLILRVPRKEEVVDYLMTRHDSILGFYQTGKQKWHIHAADALAYFYTVATPREAAFLLRAWQSPVASSSARRLRIVRPLILAQANKQAQPESDQAAKA